MHAAILVGNIVRRGVAISSKYPLDLRTAFLLTSSLFFTCNTLKLLYLEDELHFLLCQAQRAMPETGVRHTRRSSRPSPGCAKPGARYTAQRASRRAAPEDTPGTACRLHPATEVPRRCRSIPSQYEK